MSSDSDFEKRILDLWHDSNWIGSYRSVKLFQTFLKTDKNIDVSEKALTHILKNDHLYLMHLKPKVKIQRRHYVLNNYGELLQSDLGFMFEYDNFNCFLLVIDCFSLKIHLKPLKNKTSAVVLEAFKDLLKDFNTTVYKLEVDQGKEYVGVAKFCKANNILFKYKYGKNKANFAEWAVFVIKRRLYKILRGNLSQDWPSVIEKVAEDHNNTPQKKLGNLKPNDINNSFDSVIVSAAKKHVINLDPTFKEQEKNQIKYESQSKNLQENDYVYVDFKQSLFNKSFDVQVHFFKRRLYI